MVDLGVKQEYYYKCLLLPNIMEPQAANDTVSQKNKKHVNGKYFLLLLLFSAIYSSFEKNIAAQSLSTFSAFFVTLFRVALDAGILYFFVLWIVDLIRYRGGVARPENKKVRMIINIVFIILFLFIIVPLLLVTKNTPSAGLSAEQSTYVNQMLGKIQEFTNESSGVKVASQSLVDVLNKKEWSEMNNVLQNLLITTQALQPKIDELKKFIQENSVVYTSEKEKEVFSYFAEMIDVRDRHNKKLSEIASYGLKIDWNNPDGEQINKWSVLFQELGVIEKELQTAQLKLQTGVKNME